MTDEAPPQLLKLLNDLDEMKTKMMENKKNAEQLYTRFNTLNKQMDKYIHKQITQHIKKKENNKKPRGIAIPTRVTEALCVFMEQPPNTKIARTDASKYLMNYIKTNNLIDPTNKKVIIPNDPLWELIGNGASHEEQLDRFNIQKYLNKHFTAV
jgi:chromatin remodeling complex protein RSC6